MTEGIKLLLQDEEDNESSAFDSQSSSIIRLNSSTILYLREVNKYLAMVCLLREENFARQGTWCILRLPQRVQAECIFGSRFDRL